MGRLESLDESTIALLGDAARAIGTDGFYLKLLDALKCLEPWDAADIVRWSRYAAPDFLHVEGLPAAMIERYMQGYYRFDPFFRWWHDAGTGGVLTLSEAMQPGDSKSEYFTDFFFPLVEMSDVLGMYMPSIARTAIAIYIETRQGRFSPATIARAKRLYPLFLGLHDAHLARTIAELRHGRGGVETDRALVVLDRDRNVVFASPAWQEAQKSHRELADAAALAETLATRDRLDTPAGALFAETLARDVLIAPGGLILALESRAPAEPPVDFDNAFKLFAEGRLTPRETQITRLMLAGYPTEAIAKALGIGRGTVKNHRRRLYDRLDITTERELFSMFLELLAGPREAHQPPAASQRSTSASRS